MFDRELRQLGLLYAKGLYNASFYKGRIASADCFRDYESFRKIPFMYKDEIRKTSAFERTATDIGDVYGIFTSSGTSGDKTYYVYSNTDKKVHEEFVNTFYSELGIGPGDLGGVFAPVDTGVMAHTMMWQFTTRGAGYVNCPEPSPKEMISTIRMLPVTVIATRPSVVCTIYSDPEAVETARKSTVKKLILGGGFLSKERRKLIEYLWDADCYNMFGMSEVFGPMAGECRFKDGQHFPAHYLMIELLNPDTGEPVKKGETGMAVYTTLWEKGFPLLRYWTDDLMQIDETPCKCGSSLPRIRYKGRMADCIRIEKGYVFPEMLENCIMREAFYGEYRARRTLDDTVVITLEAENGRTVSEQLKKEITDLFKTDVEIVYVRPGELEYDGHRPRFTEEKRESVQ